jgi:GMP synthase-like glutamine amidotransferase
VHVRVDFVVTEHPSFLDAERARRYEEIRDALSALAGLSVETVHYLEAGTFGPGPVVLSGSSAPWAAHDPAELDRLGKAVLAADAPVLGICAGMQLQVLFAGGTVAPRAQPEVGFAPVELLREDPLLEGLGPAPVVYMHHAEDVTAVPEEVVVLARSRGCAVEAIAAPDRRWWGTQFHPECFSGEHPEGARVLSNFFALAGLGERREAGSAEAARRTAGGLVAASAADAASAG